MWWWVAVAWAEAPTVPVEALAASLAASWGRTVRVAHPKVTTATCRYREHDPLPPPIRYEAILQAAATAGIELRLVGAELVLDRASVPARPDLETHALAFDGDRTRLEAVWAAVGPTGLVNTATGALVVTADAAHVDAALAAARGPAR